MPVIIKSAFTPMTYDEITKPLLQQTEAQLAMEDSYLEANDNASKLMALANQLTDPIAYNRLKNYADDLKALADNLVANGLLTGSRLALLNMKRRYSSEINPIEVAAARREVLRKEQRDLFAKDLTLRFSTDYKSASLDDMMNNSNMDDYTMLSGNQIMQTTAALAKQYGDAIENDPQYTSILNGLYYQVMKNSGYTPELIVALANGDPNAPTELRNLSNMMHQQIADNGAYDKEWALSYINQGMTAAIGKTTYDMLQDRGYESPLAWAREKRELEKWEYEKAAAEATAGGVNGDFKVSNTALLEANGKLGKYNQLVDKFISSDGKKMDSKYVGTLGNINVMKMYENYLKEVVKATAKLENEMLAAITENAKSKYGSLAAQLAIAKGYREKIDKIKSDWWKKTKEDNPGFTTVIDKDTYELFKDLGYTSSTNMTAKGLQATINNKSMRYTMTNSGMGAGINESNFVSNMKRRMSALIESNKDKSKAYKFDMNNPSAKASSGEPIDLLDLKKATIEDVSYSMLHPEYLIVLYDDGKMALVSKEVFDTLTLGYMALAQNNISGTNDYSQKLTFLNETMRNIFGQNQQSNTVKSAQMK